MALSTTDIAVRVQDIITTDNLSTYTFTMNQAIGTDKRVWAALLFTTFGSALSSAPTCTASGGSLTLRSSINCGFVWRPFYFFQGTVASPSGTSFVVTVPVNEVDWVACLVVEVTAAGAGDLGTLGTGAQASSASPSMTISSFLGTGGLSLGFVGVPGTTNGLTGTNGFSLVGTAAADKYVTGLVKAGETSPVTGSIGSQQWAMLGGELRDAASGPPDPRNFLSRWTTGQWVRKTY